MKTKLVLNSLSVVLLAIACYSCSPSRNTQGQSGPSGFINSYIKGQDSTLYFMSSIKYKRDKKNNLEIDFTYLATHSKNDSIVCNYTLFTDNSKFSPSSLEIPNGEDTHLVSKFEKFYSEAINKKKYKYRYSFSINETVFNNWMKSSTSTIKLNNESFKPKGGYSKRTGAIKNKILFNNLN